VDFVCWIFFFIIYRIFFMKKLKMNLKIKTKINIMELFFHFYEYDLCIINNLSISIDF